MEQNIKPGISFGCPDENEDYTHQPHQPLPYWHHHHHHRRHPRYQVGTGLPLFSHFEDPRYNRGADNEINVGEFLRIPPKIELDSEVLLDSLIPDITLEYFQV